MRDEAKGEWSWVADLDVDTSKVLPLEGMEQASKLLKEVAAYDASHPVAARAEGEEPLEVVYPDGILPEPVGVGQLVLEPADCLVLGEKVLCCYTAAQRPGAVFGVLRSSLCLSADGPSRFGAFASRDDAQADAMKKASFKRLLLNQCQEEFERNAKLGGNAALVAAAKDKVIDCVAFNEALLAKYLAEGKPAPDLPDLFTEQDWVGKLKRRMLGNIKFIGELFKQSLLKEKIMHECVKLLLGACDDAHAASSNKKGSASAPSSDAATPDNESVEATIKLFLTIGYLLEQPASSKAKLDSYFQRLASLSRDKRLESRTRFMLQDLLEVLFLRRERFFCTLGVV